MEVQNLEKNQRNKIIKELCDQGAGFKQLARIIGISFGIIQRVVTDQKTVLILPISQSPHHLPMLPSTALHKGDSHSEVVFCLVPIHLTDTSLCGSPFANMTIGRCVGRCFGRSLEHTSLFQTPVYRPFAANIVRWGGHTRNTVGKAKTCINIRFLHKHAHECPLLTLPEAKQGFASSKPPLCFILKALELRAKLSAHNYAKHFLILIFFI